MEKRIVFLATIIMFVLINISICMADTNVKIEDGVLTFETQDTKAVSGTKWKTVGFTVTMKKCLGTEGNGGYPAKYQNTKIYLSNANVKTYDLGNGKVRNVFTIAEDDLTKALVDAGFDNVLCDGGTIYLNGIFQVVKNGSNYGSYIDNLNGIKYAQPWRNPNDFNDRFDIAVTYNAAKQGITVKYIDENNKILKTVKVDKTQWKKPGENFAVVLDSELVHNKKRYHLEASYFVYDASDEDQLMYKSLDYGYTLNEIKNIKSRMKLKGVTIYAVMQISKDDEQEKDDLQEYDFTNENNLRNHSRLYSEEYKNEKFNAVKAIPSGEKVYYRSTVDEYLYKGKLKNYSGEKNYKITIKKRYILKWKEVYVSSNGTIAFHTKTKNVDLEKKVNVRRKYSFWKVENVAAYRICWMDLNNLAVGGNIRQENYNNENNSVLINNQPHINEPEYKSEIILESEVIDGGDEEPVYPTMDFNSIAQKSIGMIKVRNDKLVIGGVSILDNNWSSESTNAPKKITSNSYKRIEIIKRDILIPVKTENGSYSSKSNAIYKKCITYKCDDNYSKNYITKTVDDINAITVHTPVVCDGLISNQINKCQLYNMDLSKSQLILNTVFYVKINTVGNHISCKGYYNQNYYKYTKKCMIKFPFDVYLQEKYYKSNTWIEISANESIKCFMPPWVTEGEYEIQYRTLAYNCMESGNKFGDQYNKNILQYGARDTTKVVVSGRIYNLSVYDITDYPLWEKVFRNDSGELKGVNYSVGVNNNNGNKTSRSDVFTLPFINGSHPYISSKGMLKCGYYIKFFVDTIGNMTSALDYIYITPKFYWVDNKGNRIEVDVFYNESFYDSKGIKHSNELVKIGSKMDLENIKIMGNKDKNCKYTFGNIPVSSNMQVTRGKSLWNDNKLYSIPLNIDNDLLSECGQRWFFEYYLPANIHIAKKDAVKEGDNIDFNDDSWIKGGYLVLNFEIISLDEKEIHLDYKNSFNNELYGACNMWQKEGYNIKKTDYRGNQFNIQCGDIGLFDIKKSVANDYVSAGTH